MSRDFLSNTRSIVFRSISLYLSFNDSSAGNPTQAHISGFSHEIKIYETYAIKLPLCSLVEFSP